MALSFKWWQFEKEIILMLVRWYCAYSLSYRDVEELAKERGFSVDHSTVNHWVIYFAPQLEERDKKEAFCFFRKAVGQHGLPEKVTIDQSGANRAGINKMNLLLALLFLLTGFFTKLLFGK